MIIEDKDKAIGILVQVAQMAQKSGVLSLQDAELVLSAIRALMPEQAVPQPETSVEPSEKKEDSATVVEK